MEPSLPTSFYCINYSIWILVYFFSINHIKGRCWVFSKYLYSSIEDYFRNFTCRSARCSLFVLFEKSHRNGGTKVRYLEGGPFGPVSRVARRCRWPFTASPSKCRKTAVKVSICSVQCTRHFEMLAACFRHREGVVPKVAFYQMDQSNCCICRTMHLHAFHPRQHAPRPVQPLFESRRNLGRSNNELTCQKHYESIKFQHFKLII